MRGDETDDEIDLREVFSILWAAKRLILGSTLVVAVTSIGYAFSLPNLYQSNALLAPAEDSGSALGGLLGQYSGLASMAGLTLPRGEQSKSGLAIEVLKSRAFTKEFVNKHDLLPELLAIDYWDASTQRLVIDPDIYDVKSKKWVRVVSAPRFTTPSSQEAFEEFQEILNVRQDKNTSLVSISIKHESPKIAQQWVEWLIEDVNETMRQKEIREAEESIEYLKRQAAQTTLADLDNVFFELMQAQMQRMMLAQVRREFVFTTVDPPVAPELKVEPKRPLILAVGIFVGALFGLILSLTVDYVKKRKDGFSKSEQ